MRLIQHFVKTYWHILLIVLIGVIIYINGIPNVFVNDDVAQITENATVQSVHNIPQFFFDNIFYNDGNLQLGPAYYKPLMFTSFSIIYSLFGANAIPFHIFQLIIFIANACLLFLFLKKFFRQSTAFVLSIIFLVHPINSEVALYISDLQDVLFFFFGITALLVLQSYNSIKTLIFSGVLLFLSLLSKETGLLFLLISLLYVFIYKRKQFIYFSILLASLFILDIVLRIHAIGIMMPHLNSTPIETFSFLQRVITMPALFLFYLRQLFFPLTLSVSYLWVIKQIDILHFSLPLLIDVLFLISIGLYGVYLKKNYTDQKKNLANNSYFSTYYFFAIWMLLGLVFHLQIITLDKTAADRWLYFPLVGLLGMIGVLYENGTLNEVAKNIFSIVSFPYMVNLSPSRQRSMKLHIIKNAVTRKTIMLFVIIFIISLLSARSFGRTFDFRNDLTLSMHDIQVADDYELEEELCYDYFKLGRYDLVKFHAERSIALFHFVVNYTDLGVADVFMHDFKDGKKAYLDALKYGDYDSTYNDLSALNLYYGDPKINIATIKNVYIKKFPHSPLLWLNLARLDYVNGDKKDAKIDIKKAYTLSPNDPAFTYFYERIMKNKAIPGIKK